MITFSINDEVIAKTTVQGIVAGRRYRVVNVAKTGYGPSAFVSYCLRDITTGGAVDRWLVNAQDLMDRVEADNTETRVAM